MCGIFTLLNHTQTKLTNEIIEEQAKKAQSRGPDSSKIYINNTLIIM